MWLSSETKTCHVYQGKEHLTANCPRIQERGRNEKRILRFSELYRKKRVNADNVNTIYRKAAAISQKKSYLDAARGPSSETTNANSNSTEARLSYLEEAIRSMQIILNKLVEKNTTAKASMEPIPALQNPQKTPSKTSGQTAPAHKTLERKIPPKEKPVQSIDINSSIHNPNQSNKANNNSQTGERMNALEKSVKELLLLVSKLQPTLPNDTPNRSQDTDVHMEIPAHNIVPQ